MVKNLPTMHETQVRTLGQEDPMERGKASQSSILTWRIPWTEEPGRLQSMGSVFIPIPKKGNAKECSNCCTVALISHASKGMLKILQARLQHYINRELPDVQAGFRKGRGTRVQIANIHWLVEKANDFQKNMYFIDCAKAFEYVDHNKLWKILREESGAPCLSPEKPVCWSRSNT